MKWNETHHTASQVGSAALQPHYGSQCFGVCAMLQSNGFWFAVGVIAGLLIEFAGTLFFNW